MFGRHSADEVTGQDKQTTCWFADPSVPTSACCCPGRPAVKVMVPPADGRPYPVDLWLCRHHYNASSAALALVGATAEDLVASADEPEANRAFTAA